MDIPQQPIVPTPQVPTAPPPVIEPRKHRGRTVAIVGISSLLLLAAAGAGAFYYYINTPDQVIKRSMLAMSQLESVGYDASASAGLTDPNSEDGSLMRYTLSVNGATELAGTRQVSQFSLTSSKNDEAILGPIAGELRHTDEVTYLNFSDFKIPSFMGIDSKNYTDLITESWIRIDREEILNALKLNEFNEKLEAAKQEAEAKYGNKPQELFQEYFPQFFTITDTLPSEQINGVATHHYAYTVNRDGLKAFIERLKTEFGDDLGKTGEQLEMGVAIIEAYDGLNGEIWIGKKDSYLRKLTLNGSHTEGETTSDATLSLMLTNFNAPVTVTPPPQSSSIQELMTAIVAKAAEDAKLAAADDDQDGLTMSQENAYGTDPANADTDGDGFKDGDEVTAGYNPNGPGELPKPELKEAF